MEAVTAPEFYDASFNHKTMSFFCRWCSKEIPDNGHEGRPAMNEHLKKVHGIQEPRYWE